MPDQYSVGSLLVELGLEHRISWADAERILDAGADDTHSDTGIDAAPAPIAATGWRDVAFAIVIAEGLAQHRLPEKYPRFWGGANADEAFSMDLSVENPGDNSGIRTRTVGQLRADLQWLRMLPNTRWKAERVKVSVAELETRRRLE